MPKQTRTRPIARRVLAVQSDERLVRLFREGHEAAFEEIVGRYRGPLTAFAAAIVPFHRAEDVVQNSFLRAHKALLADEREVSLRAWLFTIVRNGALNVIRDEPDWQELDPSYDGVPQPAAVAEQNEELQALVTAICALPAAQRKALVGRELEGEGHAEIAAELGTTTTAVRGLIFRARTALRNSVGALIPLPLLRLLLVEAPAIGAAGAGAGAALGGGAKLAAAISATALAVGGGVALDRDRGGAGAGVEKAQAAEQREAVDGPATGAGSLAAPAAGAVRVAEAVTAETRSGEVGSADRARSDAFRGNGPRQSAGDDPGAGGGDPAVDGEGPFGPDPGDGGGHRNPDDGHHQGPGDGTRGGGVRPAPGDGIRDGGGRSGPGDPIRDDGGHSGPRPDDGDRSGTGDGSLLPLGDEPRLEEGRHSGSGDRERDAESERLPRERT